MFKTSQAKIGWILDIYDTRLLRSTSEYVQESTDFSVLVWLVKTFWVNFKWYSFTCVKCRITTFNISWFPYILCQFFILRRSFALPRSLTMMFNTWTKLHLNLKYYYIQVQMQLCWYNEQTRERTSLSQDWSQFILLKLRRIWMVFVIKQVGWKELKWLINSWPQIFQSFHVRIFKCFEREIECIMFPLRVSNEE